VHRGYEFKWTKEVKHCFGIAHLSQEWRKEWHCQREQGVRTFSDLHKCLFTESKRSSVMKSGYCNNPTSPIAKVRVRSSGGGQGYVPSPPTEHTSVLRLLSEQPKLAGDKCCSWPQHVSCPHPLKGILHLAPDCPEHRITPLCAFLSPL